jgi:hypothetical protein
VDRFNSIGLATVLGVAAALSACDRTPTRVCVDVTGQRGPDSQCSGPGGGVGGAYRWYYARGAPPVGTYVGGGSYSPQAGVAYGTAPVEGISRGGFGGTAEGIGGGEGGGDGGAGE